jgi:hypothetical protein
MTAGATVAATATKTTVMTTKAKEDGDGRSPMRRCADDIADKIIKALVDLIDKGSTARCCP